jgi:hypothetical protein
LVRKRRGERKRGRENGENDKNLLHVVPPVVFNEFFLKGYFFETAKCDYYLHAMSSKNFKNRKIFL